MINHPSLQYSPNILPFEFNFTNSIPAKLLPFVPNCYFSESSESEPIKGVVGMAIKDICDEELFMDYRYELSPNTPQWYIPLIDL
jgi:hypothetical protein